jgi:PAS domain S-box-containing protein
MVKSDEVFYKICFDSLQEGICVANQDGIIIMNNYAIEEMFGYDEGELLGKKIELLMPEANREAHRNFFDAYLNNHKKRKIAKGREFFGLHKNGSILDLEIGLNYFELNGEIYAKALVSEISARKRRENRIKAHNRTLEYEVKKGTDKLTTVVTELERSNKMLKDEIKERTLAEKKAKRAFEREKEFNLMQTKFVSMASHEFKTPLSGILTSAGLIEKYNQQQPHEKIENHVKTIKTLVYQLNSILDDFLYLERIESDNYSFQVSQFKMCDLVSSIVQDSQPLLKEGQWIDVVQCSNPVDILHDQKVIGIIIRNVLYNAIKYSLEHSKIEMKIELNDQLTISIRDWGIGIPKEAANHVFDRFFRARNALPIQGTGIGLNIVKRHMDKLHGSIKVESEENMGTTVILKLPIIKKDVWEFSEVNI